MRSLGQIRAGANRKLASLEQQPLSDSDWDYCTEADWAKLILGDDSLPEEEMAEDLVHEIVQRVIEWRDRAAAGMPRGVQARRNRIEQTGAAENHDARIEPDWWQQERAALLQQFDDDRLEMLTLLGLAPDGAPQYLAVTDVAPFLAGVGDSEIEQGDWLRLDVPLGYERAYQASLREEDPPLIDEDVLVSESFVVWRGYSLGEPPRDGVQEQPLARLAGLAEQLSKRTGCSRAEAVAYLLCDVEPALPYVDITFDRRLGGVVLVLRDPRISAGDLARAYAIWSSLYRP